MRLLSTLTSFLALAAAPLVSAFTNPIRRPGGSDPFLTYSGDGYYYLLSTTWSTVEIARSTTIEGLKTATKKVVYSSADASRCCNVWAPEVHWLGNRWYIYFTAGGSANLDNQRMHVLRGRIGPDEWAIDASVLRTPSLGEYLVFSCFHGATYQSICIQKLNTDYVSTSGSVALISQPTQSWERVSHPVNEGPAALYFGGKTYLAYSASYCWSASYCLGLLTWDGSRAPTDPAAWTKGNGCVLSSGNGHYGTGHNSFFASPKGDQTWIAYHATANSAGACDDSRYTMVQMLGTHSNGSPNFGTPVAFSYAYGEPSK
ncbi:family 43 glycosyl hydrolase [Colletotrichum lupini]|nr:family 43 glycosyl hydrolase [Colletotrichum lupini]